MRTIERDIVGGFIFSADGKILLGHNNKGGVYEDHLVVPGGGIEEGEIKEDAVKREVLEETGIDVSRAAIIPVEGVSVGESEKTLRDTGERVLVKMTFYDFEIRLAENAEDIDLKFEDDYAVANWYTSDDLEHALIGPAVRRTLEKIEFIKTPAG